MTLRLGVGWEERQPFFFVCPNCNAATRGALLLHDLAQTELELVDGRVLDGYDACRFTVTIHPEFPSIPGAKDMTEPGGSPFLTMIRLVGDKRLMAFERVSAELRSFAKADWPGLQRLTTYYLKRDWKHFDDGIRALTNVEGLTFAEEWQRDDALHRVYDAVLMPILALDGRDYFVRMREGWNQLWSHDRPNFNSLVLFAKREVPSKRFRDVQRDLFTQVERYITHITGILPGVLCNMLPATHQPMVDGQLRLFRDDYEVLRDLYIQAFEACHKALRWVVGAANADATGDADQFPRPPPASVTAKKTPSSLDAFDKLVSAEKRKWLPLVPSWDKSWDEIFDRQVRNDIGHASAHHDLATGIILRSQGADLAYTRFVARAHHLLHGLVAAANALKLLCVYSFAPTKPA